jgi:hypothetical protein
MTMVHNAYNLWACGLCPYSGILNNKKNVSKTGPVSAFRWGKGKPTLLGPLEIINLKHCTSVYRPQQSRCLPSSHLKTEAEPTSEALWF